MKIANDQASCKTVPKCLPRLWGAIRVWLLLYVTNYLQAHCHVGTLNIMWAFAHPLILAVPNLRAAASTVQPAMHRPGHQHRDVCRQMLCSLCSAEHFYSSDSADLFAASSLSHFYHHTFLWIQQYNRSPTVCATRLWLPLCCGGYYLVRRPPPWHFLQLSTTSDSTDAVWALDLNSVQQQTGTDVSMHCHAGMGQQVVKSLRIDSGTLMSSHIWAACLWEKDTEIPHSDYNSMGTMNKRKFPAFFSFYVPLLFCFFELCLSWI